MTVLLFLGKSIPAIRAILYSLPSFACSVAIICCFKSCSSLLIFKSIVQCLFAFDAPLSYLLGNNPDLSDYPCRCLCLGFSQIIAIRPFRRITLHFSQIFLTEALTFMLLAHFLYTLFRIVTNYWCSANPETANLAAL